MRLIELLELNFGLGAKEIPTAASVRFEGYLGWKALKQKEPPLLKTELKNLPIGVSLIAVRLNWKNGL